MNQNLCSFAFATEPDTHILSPMKTQLESSLFPGNLHRRKHREEVRCVCVSRCFACELFQGEEMRLRARGKNQPEPDNKQKRE